MISQVLRVMPVGFSRLSGGALIGGETFPASAVFLPDKSFVVSILLYRPKAVFCLFASVHLAGKRKLRCIRSFIPVDV